MSAPENMFPLSSAQLGIWLAQQIDPLSPRFNFGEYFELNGRLDPVLFERALRQVVAETETLRVRIADHGGEPRQTVDVTPPWSAPFIDVSAEADGRAAAEAWMKADLAQPIELSKGPLFGFALFKTSADQFLWYARYHHVVMDGFAMSLVARRVADVYTQLCNGQVPSPRSPGSLAALLDDEAAYRASEQYASDRKYWLENLADRPDPLGPAGRPLPASDGKIRRTIYLQDECAANLHAIARRTGSTIPQIIAATAAIFLHRLIGETDLIIGLAAAARTRVSRRIPGMLANVLPLRMALHPGLSVAEAVQRTALQMRRGLRRQRFPFGDLRRDARALEDGRPVFALAVNIMPFDYSFRFADCAAVANNLSLGPVDDLALSVYDRSDGGPIRIDFDANPARYGEADLAGCQERFLRLLEAAVADPERPIGALDILGPDERRTLLHAWNDTARAVPALSLPELVAAQAARSPGRDRGGGRGRDAHLWRARGARQSARASSARARRRPGDGGRPVRRPLAGDGDGPARHSPGGRGLSAARSVLPARAARLHARRCARRRARHRGSAPRRAAARPRRPDRAARRRRRRPSPPARRPRRRSRSTRTTPPMSSTPPAPPEPPRASSSPMPASPTRS